jgi:hypothetical protein
MAEQFLTAVGIGEIVFLILVGGLFIYAIELQKEKTKLSKKCDDLEKSFDSLYDHVDDNGGFHDQKGSWGSDDFGKPNGEIGRHYQTMYKIRDKFLEIRRK